MVGCLVAVAAAAPAAGVAHAQAPARHRVSIEMRGPVALVEVDRALAFGREVGRAPADELVVDLDLPDGARLVSAEVQGPPRAPKDDTTNGDTTNGDTTKADKRADGRRALPLHAGAPGDYQRAVREGGWRRARVPLDEGADARLQVTAAGLGEGAAATAWRLRYRFVAPLACRQGALVLRMPGSLDPTPAPAEVALSVHTGGAPLRALTVGPADGRRAGGASSARAQAVVPTGAPWEVSAALEFPRARGAAQALAAAGPVGGGGVLAAALCRRPEAARARAEAPAASTAGPPPGRLLLFIDRSKSVGPAGLETARDLARALVEALPPSLSFNVVLFDRTAEPLWKLPRSATLEALRELDQALGLGALRNGTRPEGALRRARDLEAPGDPHRGEPGRRPGGPSYWVMITDGTLPDDQTPAALARALAPVSRGEVEAAVLVLRREQEERPALGALRALAAIPGRLGGVIRELPASEAATAVPAVVEALRSGGDLIDPRLRSPSAVRDAPLDQPAVVPGGGAAFLGRTPAPVTGPVTLTALLEGAPVTLSAAPAALDARAAAAVAELLAAPPAGWLAMSAEAAAVIRPVGAAAPPAVARGDMDKDVLHKALGYAYLPRARACYLTRAVKSAADFQLRGRLRLELSLARGEMMDAVVRSSTLARPDIEACLREAAFSVEIPRAMYNDAPVTAALNLVFRPRSEVKPVDASLPSPLSAEVDRILGPMTLTADPYEVLIEDP
jgi:hypothetical protein